MVVLTQKRGDRVHVEASHDVVPLSVEDVDSGCSRGHKDQVPHCQDLLRPMVPVVYKLGALGPGKGETDSMGGIPLL